MHLNEYQELARNTSKWKDLHDMSDKRENIKNAVFDCMELGEVINTLKKWLFHGHALDLGKVADEIGDTLWGIAELCTALGLSLNDVAELNINKLRIRYGDKFSTEKSVNREVVDAHTSYAEHHAMVYHIHDTAYIALLSMPKFYELKMFNTGEELAVVVCDVDIANITAMLSEVLNPHN